MSARDEAIEAAAKALRPDYGDNSQKIAAAVLAAALPVLLNDLADRIEADRNEHHTPNWNDAMSVAAETARAAAEGWGA